MTEFSLIEAVSAHRAVEIEREQKGTKTEYETYIPEERAIVFIKKRDKVSGVECVESERSWETVGREEEYADYLREGLYLGIIVPKCPQYTMDLVKMKLHEIRERVREEGFRTVHGPALFVYDYDGNVEQVEMSTSEEVQ
jgi:hypothetical protein